jgi:Mn2+/Fe2+ NRAMP family transporter
LATDIAEYMGLIIALHMLTEAAGSGGCICLDRRGPLGVAFRQTGPFSEGCRAAVALSFVVELRLVRSPLWETALPRLPEGGAVVAAAIVGAATKPHALLLH